jgi:hypothetical protein
LKQVRCLSSWLCGCGNRVASQPVNVTTSQSHGRTHGGRSGLAAKREPCLGRGEQSPASKAWTHVWCRESSSNTAAKVLGNSGGHEASGHRNNRAPRLWRSERYGTAVRYAASCCRGGGARDTSGGCSVQIAIALPTPARDRKAALAICDPGCAHRRH